MLITAIHRPFAASAAIAIVTPALALPTGCLVQRPVATRQPDAT